MITFLIGLMKARAYNIENQDATARTQRLLCFSYTVFFAIICLGAYNYFLDKQWWVWAIVIVSGMLSSGSFIEARQKYPNAPKGYGKEDI